MCSLQFHGTWGHHYLGFKQKQVVLDVDNFEIELIFEGLEEKLKLLEERRAQF